MARLPWEEDDKQPADGASAKKAAIKADAPPWEQEAPPAAPADTGRDTDSPKATPDSAPSAPAAAHPAASHPAGGNPAGNAPAAQSPVEDAAGGDSSSSSAGAAPWLIGDVERDSVKPRARARMGADSAPAAANPAAPQAASPARSTGSPAETDPSVTLCTSASGGIVRETPESPSGGIQRESASGGIVRESASGGISGGGVNAVGSGPLYIETIWKVCARFLEQKDEICKKVKIRRDALLNDLDSLYKVLYRIHEALEKNAHLAPNNYCKDLASDGALLARIAKVAVEREEQAQIQQDVISGLSSRRIVFEIEAHPDKPAMVEGWRKAAEDLMALRTYLVEEQKASGGRRW